MYKELVISIIIIILIITLDFTTQKYTDKTVKETIENLQEVKEDLKTSSLNNDEILSKINEIYNKWIEYHEKLAFFIEHDELEKVETDFVACKSLIETNKYDLANTELEKTVYVLEHICDKYSFNFTNIF